MKNTSVAVSSGVTSPPSIYRLSDHKDPPTI
jgi:hypothetical protein